MSLFSDAEVGYLRGARLGRMATAGPDGMPHVVPVSFRYNPEHDAIRSAATASPPARSTATCSVTPGRRSWLTTSSR